MQTPLHIGGGGGGGGGGLTQSTLTVSQTPSEPGDGQVQPPLQPLNVCRIPNSELNHVQKVQSGIGVVVVVDVVAHCSGLQVVVVVEDVDVEHLTF